MIPDTKPTKNTYTIVKTYIDKRGHLATHNTGIVGGSEKEALHIFRQNIVAAGTSHTQISVLVLIDAAETEIAEWTKPVESEVAQ